MTNRSDRPVRPPGDGADRPDATHRNRRYVYVAKSRRSGGLSLGIDLTPDGHCSFSCVYCQATHPPTRNPDITVDVGRMRDDLLLRLRDDSGSELKDIVLAGSGEPTAVPNLGDALEAIQDVCSTLQLRIPVRIYTNGRHLRADDVREAVGRWCRRGGEVWVKLDGARDDTVALINGRRFDVEDHLRSVWGFAAEHDIGLQTMLLMGPGLPEPSRVVDEVIVALQTGLSSGARIREVHLITLSRRPSDDRAAEVLEAVEAGRLEELGERVRRETGLVVRTFPA